MFDLEFERTADWISSNGYSKVAVQLPEGLKLRATEISDALNTSTDSEIIILGRPCYGACDFYKDYKSVADALIHYGHSAMPSLGEDSDILFIEARAKVSLDDSFTDSLERLPGRVGVMASIQYVGLIPEAVRMIEATGRKALVGNGGRRTTYPGQILGCDCTTAEDIIDSVDAFLFLGEGNFHPLATAFGADRELFVYNPVVREMRNIDDIKDRILRKRFAAITLASEAESFVIIVCNKAGQNRSSEAERMKDIIRNAGRKAYILVLDEVTPDSLIHYRVDAFVNTACPRIAMDESARFGKPMLTVPETEIVFGLREWSDYVFDAIRE